MKKVYFLIVCSLLISCGAASEHLDLVSPYLKQIEDLQFEKDKIQSKGDLSEIDIARVDYIDIEIDRITLEVNEVSRRFEENNRDVYETKNFYEDENHPHYKVR